MKYLAYAVLLFFSVNSVANESVIPSGKTLMAEAEKVTKVIDTLKLKGMIESEPDLVLVDIRTKGEINKHGGSIEAPQNINIARGWLEFDIQSNAQDKNTPIVVYCGGGLRSPLAAKTLQDMGYTNVWDYSAGYFGWRKFHNR